MMRLHLIGCAGALALLGGCAGWSTTDADLYDGLTESRRWS